MAEESDEDGDPSPAGSPDASGSDGDRDRRPPADSDDAERDPESSAPDPDDSETVDSDPEDPDSSETDATDGDATEDDADTADATDDADAAEDADAADADDESAAAERDDAATDEDAATDDGAVTAGTGHAQYARTAGNPPGTGSAGAAESGEDDTGGDDAATDDEGDGGADQDGDSEDAESRDDTEADDGNGGLFDGFAEHLPEEDQQVEWEHVDDPSDDEATAADADGGGGDADDAAAAQTNGAGAVEPAPGKDAYAPEYDAEGTHGVGADAAHDVHEPGSPDPDLPGGVHDRPPEPPDDEEMPLTEHIEEMVKRLAVVLGVVAVVTVIAFPFAENTLNFIWYHVHPGVVEQCVRATPAEQCTPPHLYGPLELKLTEIKVASLAGLVLALPVFVYQTYLFMRPGLYPHERRYYLAAVPTSLVLALVGIAFAYFFIIPALFVYFLYYTQETAVIAFALRETFDLILMLMGFLAVSFQIPLFIMLAIMMGVTSRRWLVERRLLFWGGFFGVSWLFAPDPTGVAPILVTLVMIALFEGTLLLLRWTER